MTASPPGSAWPAASLTLLAAVGAALGLGNILLSWRLFGTDRDADVWMMAMAIAQTLGVLSQVGVEQVAVFAARARAAGQHSGRQFDRDSLQWALVFGLLFAALTGLLLHGVAALFATGFDATSRERLVAVLLPLLLQLAVAPVLFVLRQLLLLDQRSGWSIALGHAFGAVQCVVLAAALAGLAGTPQALAWWLGAGSLAVALAAVARFAPLAWHWQAPDWRALAPFVRASFAMRLTHSVHNLLVVALTNAALSAGAAGTVALFQYAKRLVDGLTSVAVGPHMAVLHARQATAWTLGDAAAFRRHARHYLGTAVPALVGLCALALVLGWAWGAWTGSPLLQPGTATWTLVLLLCAWQLVMAIETVAAGVLSYENRAGWMFAVNGLFIACFVLALQVLLPQPADGVGVALAALACQLLSLVLFTGLARRLYRRRLATSRHA